MPRASTRTRTRAHDFDAFIAVDWSGAKGLYEGVAVAECRARSAVRLVHPVGRRWTRSAVVAWLAERLSRGERLLVGFDFAFGLPWSARSGYLDGRFPHVTDMFGLWALVNERSQGAEDCHAGPFLDIEERHESFWIRGKMPAWWGDGHARRRATEIVCGARTGTYPVSVLKIAAASKQVGKASLAGMRALHALRAEAGAALAIWPRQAVEDRSVVVEIFPTLYRRRGAGRLSKIRDRAALDTALLALGASAHPTVPHRFDDHQGDALVSAAGLRAGAAREGTLDEGALGENARLREGWIFDVEAPLEVAVSPPDSGLGVREQEIDDAGREISRERRHVPAALDRP